MKKWLLGLFILASPSFIHAISPVNEDSNVLIHYSNASVDTSTSIVMMDLSDTTNFKHRYTGNFVISEIHVAVDRTGSSGVTSSTGTIKIGVVNVVNASTGSVTYFYEFPILKSGSFTAPVSDSKIYSPSFLRCKVIPGANINTDGETPYIVSNSKDAGSTSFQDDTTIPTTLGDLVYPTVGDIILSLTEATAGSYAISVDILYHSNR